MAYDTSIIEQFKRDEETLAKTPEPEVEAQIRRFVEDYPIEKLPALTLSDYVMAPANLGNNNSFCRRLRYNVKNCSMGNAFPAVFGVYQKGAQLTLSKTLQNLYGSSIEEAFRYEKSEIVEVLRAFGRGDLERVANSDLNSQFRHKLLSVYYPGDFIPVCTNDALNAYCEAVGAPYKPNDAFVYRNRSLLAFKNEVAAFNGWSNFFFMRFCDWLWRNKRRLDVRKLADVE